MRWSPRLLYSMSKTTLLIRWSKLTRLKPYRQRETCIFAAHSVPPSGRKEKQVSWFQCRGHCRWHNMGPESWEAAFTTSVREHICIRSIAGHRFCSLFFHNLINVRGVAVLRHMLRYAWWCQPHRLATNKLDC